LLGDSLGYLCSAALRVAVRFGVADHLAAGPLTAERLAALGGAQPDHLTRVLRFLATRGVFREDLDGAFSLTTVAQLLRSDSPLAMASLFTQTDLKLNRIIRTPGTLSIVEAVAR
jgi:hypothetical protein